ncbi:hypothetical protein D5R95_00670 [Methanosalsum natronophilum]|uniref:DUF7343 domain-containing protein n=1 Tax=Methanosalsum natronophilum TaxID=768733 RepID=A0A3R8CE63_9EURY|nr:MAG: hypothetical protein D5R95_00670 [Methanosalsum natronophilum]
MIIVTMKSSRFSSRYNGLNYFSHYKNLYYISLIVITILILSVHVVNAGSNTATLQGTAYEWHSFEPLKNTVIEVNSTPTQAVVARDGTYSLNLPPGEYKITARYYEDGELTLYGEEIITVQDEGMYNLDLLLLPAFDDEPLLDPTTGEELDQLFEEDPTYTDSQEEEQEQEIEDTQTPDPLVDRYAGIILIVLFLILLIGLYFIKKNQRSSTEDTNINEDDEMPIDSESEIEQEKPTLSPELNVVINAISENGGRITQRDLRKKLNYSESKMSLILSELEYRGHIEKFKHGRGNVVILVDPNSTQSEPGE